MKKYSRQSIMQRAWRIYRAYPQNGFAKALSRAWQIEKQDNEPMTANQINRIINRLKPLSIAGTKTHCMIVNSKKGRAIMRLADDNETKQMLMEGAVFPGDIMRDRKYERTRFHFTPRPQRPFRNRIVNLANCERVDVAAFVAQMESA